MTDTPQTTAAIRDAALEEAALVCQQAASRLINNGRARVNQIDRHTADVLINQMRAIRALKSEWI